MDGGTRTGWRFWRATGAAMALTAVISMAVGFSWVDATRSDGERPVLVPITPCRLADTRASAIGPNGTLQADATITIDARGEQGECDLPGDALALSMNITSVGATAATFVTVWPAGPMPTASSLNPVPGQPPTPNAVTTPLSDTGSFNVYNRNGTVDLIVDVNGYFAHHDHDDRYDTSAEVDAKIAASAGTTGPQGPAGPEGPTGPQGPKGDPGAPAIDPPTVVWVAKSGGDFATLGEALATIGDRMYEDPHLIKIAPGVYEETATLELRDHVDVEGSGLGVTTIQCACGDDSLDSSAVVHAGSIEAQLRKLTIENLGGADHSTAIRIDGGETSAFSLFDLRAFSTGGAVENRGISVHAGTRPGMHRVISEVSGSTFDASAVYNDNASPFMTDVLALARDGIHSRGVVNVASSPLMSDVTALASSSARAIGVLNMAGSTPTMTDVTAEADGDGAAANAIAVWNQGSSPTMTRVVATAHATSSGSNHTTGVLNSTNASPAMDDVLASASGAAHNYGVQNTSWSTPSMRSVTAKAEGGDISYAIQNSSASPTLDGVTAEAFGATESYGISSESEPASPSSIEARNSVISGETNSIRNGENYAASIAHTQLRGSVTGDGFTCIGAYDENYEALGGSCAPSIPEPLHIRAYGRISADGSTSPWVASFGDFTGSKLDDDGRPLLPGAYQLEIEAAIPPEECDGDYWPVIDFTPYPLGGYTTIDIDTFWCEPDGAIGLVLSQTDNAGVPVDAGFTFVVYAPIEPT